MKKHLSSIFTISATLALLSGCASYHAAPLNNLSSDAVCSSSVKNSDVIVLARSFDKVDCKRYLDRDVLAKGYQPVQLYIQNNSDQSYSFSLDRIDIPHARAEAVAAKVHTSTVGRILGYGIPGLVVVWPLIIPAVVDGIKSSDANEALDMDFSSKAAKNQIINPYTHFNKILFVPVNDHKSSFNITLINQESNEPQTFKVFVG